MKELTIIEQTIENLKVQNDILLKENLKLKAKLEMIKEIAKGVRSYLEVPTPRDVRFEMDRILDLITETELPDQKESEER